MFCFLFGILSGRILFPLGLIQGIFQSLYSLKQLAPPVFLVEVVARHQEKATVTSGHGEGGLFCVGFPAVLQGASPPQSPHPAPMLQWSPG